MNEFAVEIKNLTKRYGSFFALDNTSIDIPANKVIGLVGPNGAGKSSLLKIITGLSLGTSGYMKIFGNDATETKSANNIGFMQENNPLPETMRVGQYLRFRAALKGVNGKEIRIHVEKIMRLCDLYYEARNKIIKTLSKGFRQRVGIADALIGEPNLIILDEPTIGLDPHQIIGIRNLIDKAKQNSTMIISSHILTELENICNYFIIINRGLVIASGDLYALRKQFFDTRIIIVNVSACTEQIIAFCKSIHLSDFELETNEQSKICKIKIKLPISNQFESLIEKFSSNFGSQFLGFYEKQQSLENIFIEATKRCMD